MSFSARFHRIVTVRSFVSSATTLLLMAVTTSVGMAQDDAGARSRQAADVAAIRAAIQQTAAAINAHDVDGVMAHYARDVQVSYPGIKDTGYDDFYASYRQMMGPAVTTRTTPTIEEVAVSGDLAMVRITWDTTITAKDTGRVTTRKARDLQVWRREKDGWKFARGMWHHVNPDALRPSLTAISVANLDESVRWYADTLGFTVVTQRAFAGQRLRLAILERDGFRVELVELEGSQPAAKLLPAGAGNPAMIQGFGKLAFTVGDFDAWLARVRRAGVRFQLEPQTNAEDGTRSFIILDNNGNWLQFRSVRP